MRSISFRAAAIATVILGATLLFFLLALPQRLVFSGAQDYRFFVGDGSLNFKEIACEGSEAALLRLKLDGISGECATFEELDLDAFLDETGARVLFVEELSDSVNYYCSAPIAYSVELYGQTVNLHVCVKSDCVKVGSPIIFGGY